MTPAATILGAFLGGIMTLAATMVSANPDSAATEYEVKAAFLYNFAKFVRWPEDAFSGPEAPLRVCVLGEDPFGETLDETIGGKEVRDRRVVVQRVSSAAAAGDCQIVFVSVSERRGLRWILEELETRPVLTVADVERFTERGGIVSLVLERRRVRFEVNVDAAERAGLRVSSQLLRLARRVWSERGEVRP